MKTLGFLTGAAIAAAGLLAWTLLTSVSDASRLDTMLTACLTYATTGATPFPGQGRSVGVYDAPLFEGAFVADTHRILEGGRFEAAWETVEDEVQPYRLCRVTARFDGSDQLSFQLDGDLVEQVTKIIAPFGALQPETDRIAQGPRTLGWFEADKPAAEGLRVVLVASPERVASFLVANEVAD